jgi:hypothetical protein
VRLRHLNNGLQLSLSMFAIVLLVSLDAATDTRVPRATWRRRSIAT